MAEVELYTLVKSFIPGLSEIFWIIFCILIILILYNIIKEFIEKMSIYLSIRFFDRYTNPGTCIKFDGFFGSIKQITLSYILLEYSDCEKCEVKVYRKIPIKQFDQMYKDYYKTSCYEICKDFKQEKGH